MRLRNWHRHLLAVLAVFLLGAASGCVRDTPQQVSVTSLASAADGLDLQAVGELLKKAKDGEQFEQLLNDADEGLNNLDLDEDGNVEFIKVTEYGEGDSTGFSLTVDMGDGEEQEIATIDLVKTTGGDVDVELQGNPQVYGPNHYYSRRYGVGDYLLLGYLFSPHGMYFSPYRHGFYPGFYRPYPVVGITTYRTRTAGVASRSTARVSRASGSTAAGKATSPNAGKTSSKIKAPLKNPTQSQKAFQARNPSKQVRSGGFGSRRTSVRGSRSFRGGGFGGGK